MVDADALDRRQRSSSGRITSPDASGRDLGRGRRRRDGLLDGAGVHDHGLHPALEAIERDGSGAMRLAAAPRRSRPRSR